MPVSNKNETTLRKPKRSTINAVIGRHNTVHIHYTHTHVLIELKLQFAIKNLNVFMAKLMANADITRTPRTDPFTLCKQLCKSVSTSNYHMVSSVAHGQVPACPSAVPGTRMPCARSPTNQRGANIHSYQGKNHCDECHFVHCNRSHFRMRSSF
jgi:hypothetical protein